MKNIVYMGRKIIKLPKKFKKNINHTLVNDNSHSFLILYVYYFRKYFSIVAIFEIPD